MGCVCRVLYSVCSVCLRMLWPLWAVCLFVPCSVCLCILCAWVCCVPQCLCYVCPPFVEVSIKPCHCFLQNSSSPAHPSLLSPQIGYHPDNPLPSAALTNPISHPDTTHSHPSPNPSPFPTLHSQLSLFGGLPPNPQSTQPPVHSTTWASNSQHLSGEPLRDGCLRLKTKSGKVAPASLSALSYSAWSYAPEKLLRPPRNEAIYCPYKRACSARQAKTKQQ